MSRRYTGVPPEIRIAVLHRARYLCEVCGLGAASNLHHRKPRGMGGTRDDMINSPANLLGICGSGTTGCHGKIESYRRQSYDLGWLVRRWREPSEVPFLGPRDDWYLLDDTGGKRRVSPPG